jgi:integrase
MTTDEIETVCREAWASEGLCEKTIHAYLLVFRRAQSWAVGHGTSVLALTATEVRELADSWPRTRASRQQLRVTLARVWQAAAQRSPAAALAVPVPTKPRYRCRALPEASAAVLAAAAASDRSPAGLAVLLGLYAGLRREEIAGLRWAQIRDGWLSVVGKCEVSGEIPLHPVLAEELHLRLVGSGCCGPFVFPGERGREHVCPATVWLWSRRVSRRALGFEVPTHVLRHTAIATLNDATHDLRAAQEFARHLSPETTVLYTRVSRRRLIEAVAAIDYAA